jgi:hypothetical protein
MCLFKKKLSIIRVIKWVRNVAHNKEMRNAYEILIGKLEENGPLGRMIRRAKDNIKTDVKETGCEGVDGIQLAQYRVQWPALVDTVTKLRSP